MAENDKNTILQINSGLLEKGRDYVRQRTFTVKTGAFIFVTQGRVDMTVNLSDYSVSQHTFVTVIQGSMMQLRDWSDDFQAYCINLPTHFTRDLDLWKSTAGSIRVIIENPVLTLEKESHISFVNNYFKLLLDLSDPDEITFGMEIMKNMLEGIMFAVSGFYRDMFPSDGEFNEAGPLSRRHDIFKSFIDIVTQNYETHRDVSYYADILCITPKHLGYVVKSASGKLASDVISSMVIMDAKSKLKSTNLSVSQISDSLNFPNPSFFCKYFRKHTGKTPRQFRETQTGISA